MHHRQNTSAEGSSAGHRRADRAVQRQEVLAQAPRRCCARGGRRGYLRVRTEEQPDQQGLDDGFATEYPSASSSSRPRRRKRRLFKLLTQQGGLYRLHGTSSCGALLADRMCAAVITESARGIGSRYRSTAPRGSLPVWVSVEVQVAASKPQRQAVRILEGRMPHDRVPERERVGLWPDLQEGDARAWSSPPKSARALKTWAACLQGRERAKALDEDVQIAAVHLLGHRTAVRVHISIRHWPGPGRLVDKVGRLALQRVAAG